MHQVDAALAPYGLGGGELQHAVDVVRLADADEDLARFHVQHGGLPGSSATFLPERGSA